MEKLKKYWIAILIVFGFFMFYKPLFCFLFLGILVTFLGINSWIFIIDVKKNGIESVGEILFYESDYEGYKTPTIEFKTKNGKLIKKEPYYYASTDLSKIRTYKDKINDSVSILYNPQNPEKFIVKSQSNFNYLSIIFTIIIGVSFFIIGTLSLLDIISIDF